MSERSTLPLAGSASPARSHANGMGQLFFCLIAILLGGTANARTITIPPPAMSTFADTEVSTNIAFNADDAHLREFETRFALEGSL